MGKKAVESSGSESEEEVKVTKPSKVASAKKEKKPKSDSESEEEVKPTKASKDKKEKDNKKEKKEEKKVEKKKDKKKKEESEESSSEEEAPKAPAKAPAKTAAPAAKKVAEKDSDDEESSSEEEPTTKAAAKPAADKRKRESDDEDDEEEEAPKKSKSGGPTTLTIENLVFSIDDDQIREFFENCGTISDINWIEENGRFSGRGIIEFETPEAAAKALAKNGQDCQGRNIIVLPPRDSVVKPPGVVSLFVGKCPPSIDDDKIKELFKEVGELTSIRWSTDRETGEFRGFGWIDFATEEECVKGFILGGNLSCDGSKLKIDYASPPGEKSGGGGRGGRGGGRGGGGRGGGGRGGRGGFGGRGGGGRGGGNRRPF